MSRRVTWASDLGCSIGTRVTQVTRVAQLKLAQVNILEYTRCMLYTVADCVISGPYSFYLLLVFVFGPQFVFSVLGVLCM